MDDRLPPTGGRWYADNGTPESEMEMLLDYPELEGLEPFYIEWEFIWPM